MKYKLMAIALMLCLIPSAVVAQTYTTTGYSPPGETPSFRINLLKYDPYPAEPGKYMTLWIEVYNTGTNTAKNVVFELEPEYPFSLDSNENATREFSSIPGLFTVVLQYKVRVDTDAVDGWNEIKLKYKIGNGDWVEKKSEIYVNKAPNEAELTPLFVSADPIPYPGGETKLTINIANVAPGSAYYTIVKAESPIATIPVNKIFVGTLDADDFESVEFDMKIKDNIKPGRYPVYIKSYYKNEDYKKVETNGTVYIQVYPKEEAIKELTPQTPWYMYLIYIIIILAALKYFIIPWTKKAASYIKKK
ncbi:MAG: hypothetical protein J7K87_00080 [Candidatus Aenigmarchaeota archaeon]|nr:hypothetical protein [Candidatus Aenigmarchaeota archaeon]